MRYYITLVIITLVAISGPKSVPPPAKPKIKKEATESKQQPVAEFQ